MERGTSGSGTGIKALLAGLVMAATVAVLAGCATGAATTGPSRQPTPTKTTNGTPGALPTATCGRASTHGLSATTQILSADKGALNCFHVAARDCKTASIAVTEMGVDTGTNHVFAIEPGGKSCTVSDTSQDYSANFGGSHGKIGAARCSVAAVSSGGVTLACNGEKVLIPARVTRL
jgi:hypothetical protein